MSLETANDRVGAMRHRIKLMEYVTSRNELGEEITSFQERAEVWASVEHNLRSSDENEQAQRQTAKIVTQFKIRHRTGLDEKMKVQWQNKDWDIKSILPDNHLKYIILECEYFK